MIVEFKLPPIGEGVDSADIAEILIQPGDTISNEPVVMELETEKAVMELTCPLEGVIRELKIAEGDTITVGQTLFTVDVESQTERNVADSSESPVSAARTSEARPAPAREVMQASEPVAAAANHSAELVASNSSAANGQTSGNETQFVLPNIGEGVDSADIAEIHVSVGDKVAKNDTVMDLETEKAVVELPVDVAGTITAIHVSVGDTVQVGQQLLTISGVESLADKPSGEREKRTEPVPSERAQPSLSQRETTRKGSQSSIAAPVAELVTADGNGRPSAPVPAAPSTRRLARQLGVDLRKVGGSGPGGRITQEDVQTFVRRSLQETLPAVPDRQMSVLAPGSLAPPPLPDFSKFGLVEREKLSKLGRTAAENLSVSWSVIPHVTQHDRADVTDLETARKRFAQGASDGTPKVTMTAIVMKALAACLQEYPKFNSSLDPETSEIVYKRYYHLGCAVDTPSGLLVPVVRDCDQKSIREIAAELSELASLARDRKLPLDAMQGATCTVTNLGGIGGIAFTPIVNYPEVCILGMTRGQKELQLNDGEISERLMLPLSLSYDHRVINGADAARFMVSLCNLLADPFQLLSAI